MLKLTKILLITGGAIFALGVVITVGGIFAIRSSAAKKTDVVYEKQEVVITDDVSAIKIGEVSQDVEIKPSEDGEIKVEYYDADNYIHKVDVKGDTLSVEVNALSDNMQWWEMVTISQNWFNDSQSFDHPVVIYLPEGTYDSAQIDSVSGDITLPEGYVFNDIKIDTTSGDITSLCGSAGEIVVNTISGEVKIANCTPSNISVNTTSGYIFFDDMTVGGNTDLDTISGEVTLTNLETKDISVSTTSGDIILKNLTTGTADFDTTSGEVSGTVTGDHEFDADTVSGDIEIPSNIKGEPGFSISTVSGDITIDAV